MRTVLTLALAASLGACGIDGVEGDGDDGGNPPTPDGAPPVREPAFRLTSPPIEMPAGLEATYCWYFRAPTNKLIAIDKWKSSMTPGSHHLILYTTPNDRMPPGTITPVNCSANGLASTWTYSAQSPEAEIEMPLDDGEGKRVAMDFNANQAGFIQMHYYNTSDQPLMVSVTVEAYALDEGVPYTKTAAYVTYNNSINIPPNTVGDIEAQTCNVPATSKFWMISTHSHKQAVRTGVRDGMPNNGAMVFQSTDWDHPGAQKWMAKPFHTFSTGKITYECEYNNPTNRTIRTGDSAQTDEMCMASGYFFPATKPAFCFDGFVI